MTRRRTGATQAVRDLCFGRDQLACVMCGSTYQLTLQHRRCRGAGGSRRQDTNSPANLVTLCGSGTTGCHGFVEGNPDLARAAGYRVDQHQTPAEVPLIWHGTHVLLDDEGGVTPVEVAA